MRSLVDVHIIRKPQERWIDECLASLRDERVNIHFVNHVDGSIAVPRGAGFRLGEAPYVSFVDPDDTVVPGVFAKCVEVLESLPDLGGVHTDEVLVNSDGTYLMHGWSTNQGPFHAFGYRHKLMSGVHHLRVLRRCVVEKCLPLKTARLPEPILMVDINRRSGLLRLPFVGYKWRIHGDNAFLKFTKAELDEAESMVAR